jgi:phosphoserine phosphatase
VTSAANLTRTALVYDFDGTLAPGNIQEHALIPGHLQSTKETFWAQVAQEKRQHDADEILVYLRLLLERARALGKPITREVLRSHAAATPLFEGVEDWFARINAHARERGLQLEHYVVSSGNEEMIEGTRIAHQFTKIFASRYHYDAAGLAIWPAVAVNYTSKTQYLFRINKGVDNCWDNEPVNRWIPLSDRPMPFTRMVYLGDGDTDIPSMKMVRHQGGHSVAVFDPKRWASHELQDKVYNLIAEDRAHFVVPGDYRAGSQLDVTIKGILGRIARDQAGYRGA